MGNKIINLKTSQYEVYYITLYFIIFNKYISL